MTVFPWPQICALSGTDPVHWRRRPGAARGLLIDSAATPLYVDPDVAVADTTGARADVFDQAATRAAPHGMLAAQMLITAEFRRR